MRSCLLCTLGTSPMVVTELLRYLRRTDNGLHDVVIIPTKSENVLTGANLLVGAIRSEYPDVRVHIKKLSMGDINGEESLLDYLSEFVDIVVEERERYSVEKIYLNVSGGRKIQAIISTLYAGILGMDEVYDIIDKNIENVNVNFEKVKDIFQKFRDTDDPVGLYAKHKKELHRVMYPDEHNLVFLKSYVIKFPRDEILKLKRAIEGISIEDEDIEDYRLKAYRSSGLITFDRKRTYGTELGKIILKGLA